MTTHLPPNHVVALMLRRCFPSYTGKKFHLEVVESVHITTESSSGTSSRWALIDLVQMRALAAPPSMQFPPPSCTFELPSGWAVAEHHTFCGRLEFLRLHVRADNMRGDLLPSPEAQPTRNQLIVLVATRSLKSSYNGIKDYRCREAMDQTKISLREWTQALEECQARGWLDSRKAITINGKNIVGSKQLHQLREQEAQA